MGSFFCLGGMCVPNQHTHTAVAQTKPPPLLLALSKTTGGPHGRRRGRQLRAAEPLAHDQHLADAAGWCFGGLVGEVVMVRQFGAILMFVT